MYWNNKYIKIECRIQLTIEELLEVQDYLLNYDFGVLEEVKVVKLSWSNKKKRRVKLTCWGGREYVLELFNLFLKLKEER